MAEQKKKNYCQNCKHYKKPRCKLHEKFTARKNKCDDFEAKK